MELRDKAFFVGIAGDAALQVIVRGRGDLAGLKSYFDKHGPEESLFIAGAIMYFAVVSYEWTGFEVSNSSLFMYGGLLDIAWRQLRIFPSLDGYYQAMTPVESFIWGGVPLLIANSI